jgi:hypothetical protein
MAWVLGDDCSKRASLTHLPTRPIDSPTQTRHLPPYPLVPYDPRTLTPYSLAYTSVPFSSTQMPALVFITSPPAVPTFYRSPWSSKPLAGSFSTAVPALSVTSCISVRLLSDPSGGPTSLWEAASNLHTQACDGKLVRSCLKPAYSRLFIIRNSGLCTRDAYALFARHTSWLVRVIWAHISIMQ